MKKSWRLVVVTRLDARRKGIRAGQRYAADGLTKGLVADARPARMMGPAHGPRHPTLLRRGMDADNLVAESGRHMTHLQLIS